MKQLCSDEDLTYYELLESYYTNTDQIDTCEFKDRVNLNIQTFNEQISNRIKHRVAIIIKEGINKQKLKDYICQVIEANIEDDQTYSTVEILDNLWVGIPTYITNIKELR